MIINNLNKVTSWAKKWSKSLGILCYTVTIYIYITYYPTTLQTPIEFWRWSGQKFNCYQYVTYY